MAEQPLMNTYGRIPVAFERGEGAWLFDTQGNKYFDALSGIAVCGLGHAHPAVTEAIRHQAGRLVHCSNIYQIPQQVELARELCEVSGMDRVFFGNSGAEANEAAIKLARMYGHQRGIDVPTIIVMEGSFHGRTMATLTATANRKVQAGFEPLLSGFVRTPFNDIQAIHNIAESNNNIVAVLLEPVQGEGGINPVQPEYLQALRKVCDEKGWLLMLDEIQTGNGRTGTYFAFQHMGVVPDVVTTAKGLGNGFPIGACLARGQAAEVFQPGNHGSTFGGNPLACATALAVVRTIRSQNIAERARVLGERILQGFQERLRGADYIKSIRGHGMMFGIELVHPCPELVPLAKTQGLLINVTAERVIRLLPPLILTDEEADYLVDKVTRLIKVYAGDDRMRPR